MNEAIINAIFVGLGSVVTIVCTGIVNIIKAKKETKKEEMIQETKLDEFKRWANDFSAQQEKINSNFTSLNGKLEDYQDQNKAIFKSQLRHSICNIYFQNVKNKTLDMHTKEDLSSLYDAYESLGGNSFAHKLYEEMMEWEIKE